MLPWDLCNNPLSYIKEKEKEKEEEKEKAVSQSLLLTLKRTFHFSHQNCLFCCHCQIATNQDHLLVTYQSVDA
jgi:hypothetical protein